MSTTGFPVWNWKPISLWSKQIIKILHNLKALKVKNDPNWHNRWSDEDGLPFKDKQVVDCPLFCFMFQIHVKTNRCSRTFLSTSQGRLVYQNKGQHLEGIIYIWMNLPIIRKILSMQSIKAFVSWSQNQ